MTTRLRGSRTLAGALVTVDNLTQQPKEIAFQYNPATLQRTLQPQMVGGCGYRTASLMVAAGMRSPIPTPTPTVRHLS